MPLTHRAVNSVAGYRKPTCRQATRAIMMAGSEDTGGLFGGFFANVFGGVTEVGMSNASQAQHGPWGRLFLTDRRLGALKQANEDKTRVVNAITNSGGWDLSLDLGSQIARQLGGSGEVSENLCCISIALFLGNVG